MNMKQRDIHTYLEKAKKDIVERGLCDNYGDIESEGHRYLHTILHGGESWGELWDSDSVWIPDPEYDYASVEEMSNKDVWRYVYNRDLTEKSLRIFCIAYGIDYDELTDNKTVILDDDEDFVV